jgi:hypothetical protein
VLHEGFQAGFLRGPVEFKQGQHAHDAAARHLGQHPAQHQGDDGAQQLGNEAGELGPERGEGGYEDVDLFHDGLHGVALSGNGL